MHSGPAAFEPCGREGCAECHGPDPTTRELCGSGTAPADAADRAHYDAERARHGGRALTPEARMKRQQVPSAANWRARAGAAAARLQLADGDWRGGEEVGDPRTLRPGETLLWKGPGPTPARWPCIPATLVRIDERDAEAPLLLRTDDGAEHGAGLSDVARVPARRQVACAVCARRNWKSPARFKVVRLWDTRAQRGRQPDGDDQARRWAEEARTCAYDPADRRAQQEAARMLCPARYLHPPLSCV